VREPFLRVKTAFRGSDTGTWYWVLELIHFEAVSHLLTSGILLVLPLDDASCKPIATPAIVARMDVAFYLQKSRTAVLHINIFRSGF
jgi:hypothetical protein